MELAAGPGAVGFFVQALTFAVGKTFLMESHLFLIVGRRLVQERSTFVSSSPVM